MLITDDKVTHNKKLLKNIIYPIGVYYFFELKPLHSFVFVGYGAEPLRASQ